MNIRDLKYLVALSEHQHFRKAAEACFISQPTLSGQIRKLENELGVMLFERTSRKVLFTNTGLRLVAQAQRILSEVKILEEMASQQGEEMSGPFHIGVIPTVGPYLMPYIVPVIKKVFPHLDVFLYEAQTHQLIQLLSDGKLDCLLLASVKETAHLKEIPLYEEPMLLAVPQTHSWANQKNIAMKDLKGETLLMLGDGHCLSDHAMGFCFTAGAKDDVRFRATSLETLRNMVAAETGITLLPKLAVPTDLNRDGVTYIKVTNPEPKRLITLAYRPGSPLRNRYERLAKEIIKTVESIFN